MCNAIEIITHAMTATHTVFQYRRTRSPFSMRFKSRSHMRLWRKEETQTKAIPSARIARSIRSLLWLLQISAAILATPSNANNVIALKCPLQLSPYVIRGPFPRISYAAIIERGGATGVKLPRAVAPPAPDLAIYNCHCHDARAR